MCRWRKDWREVYFRVGDPVPMARTAVREFLFSEQSVGSPIECRASDRTLMVEADEVRGGAEWQFWVECDNPQDLYMEARVKLDSREPVASRKSVVVERLGSKIRATITADQWSVRLYEGKPLGVWSRMRDGAGTVVA